MSVVGGGAASRRLVQAERERDALSLPWCVVSVSYLRALVSGGGIVGCAQRIYLSRYYDLLFFTIFVANFAGCFLSHVCCIKSLPYWQVVYSIGLPSVDEKAPNTKFLAQLNQII